MYLLLATTRVARYVVRGGSSSCSLATLGLLVLLDLVLVVVAYYVVIPREASLSSRERGTRVELRVGYLPSTCIISAARGAGRRGRATKKRHASRPSKSSVFT